MKNNLKDIITETNKNLMRSSIFFVTNNLINQLKLNDDKEVVSLMNKLYLLDENGVFHEADNKNVWNVAFKTGFFNENVFILYNIKDEYGDESFRYVTEKYGEQLEAYLSLTKWLKLHALFHVKNLSKEQNKALNTQYNLYLNHKLDFEKKFKVETELILDENSKKPQSVFKNIKSFIPELNALKDASRLSTTTMSQGRQTTNHNNKKTRLKKLKRDIELKAANQVLKNVFNVDL